MNARAAWWAGAGLAFAALCMAGPALASATLTINVTDGAGEGFNDPTPFTPIGGNNATTLGQARLNVFNRAAQLWGAIIDSATPIVVEASFDPLTCSANSGTLGSAGPKYMYLNFPGAGVQGVWYPSALANALKGARVSTDPTYGADIFARFNSAIGGDQNCLLGEYLYLGYDHKLTGHADGKVYVADLLGVVLHELGHGLGFISMVDQTGAGLKDNGGTAHLGIFDQFVYDDARSMFFKDPAMTDALRAGSSVGNANLAFNGTHVNAQSSRETAGLTTQGHVRLYAPATWSDTSSISHFDVSASPDLLMEPNYSLATGSHADLASCALYDLGWGGTRCPDDLKGVAQSVTVTAGSQAAITLGSANDNGAALTFTIATQPAHGSLGTASGNSVTYTPVAGYTGGDSFTYTVADALWTSQPATVSITVQAASSGGGTAGGGTAGGGGGGGAVDWLSLLWLAGACLARCLPLRQRAVGRVAPLGRRASR